MKDVKMLMQDHYLKYASYVILERAIPGLDGFKPVQRRILQTLWQMHNGKLHKVQNVAGQTMALHPHGDAAIVDAMINLANKGFLLDTQGNFGNPLTGDPAAAGRYIETRLSPLALETLFNPSLTAFVPSYDGRQQEPVCLPAKIPVLLMQGTDGIAVGMSTHILPHNFVELLEAQIAILEEQPYLLLPDFPTGGIMDASNYDKGKGKVKLRVKLAISDPKTILIQEICYGTTTESLIRSIDEAAKRGKIKIDGINDYTAEKIAIEIKLPRGHYAEELIAALYVYTDCEVTITPQMMMIKDGLPWEGDVHEILELNTEKLKEFLKLELEIERDRLQELIFEKSLERIFIENRLYKPIETLSTIEEIHTVIEEGLEPFCKDFLRQPNREDREKLLSIPIRRISLFDLEKNRLEIAAAEKLLAKAQKDLKELRKVAITYIRGLIAKYGKNHPRRTQFKSIESVNLRDVATKTVKIGYDPVGGFVGSKVTGSKSFECTNFDKILIFYSNGTYRAINIPEKQYIDQQGCSISYVGVADKKSVFNIVCRDTKTNLYYAKRFVVDKFIVDKVYNFIEKELELIIVSTKIDLNIELTYIPKVNQRTTKTNFNFKDMQVKGVSALPRKMSPREIKKHIVKD
ncbi:MAG: DNA topoisomerase IV subunit A [Parachlamydiaceae bacterium]|nr:DNA topoisomerase IV subunit A [Parachlamydiaceae bacterium]